MHMYIDHVFIDFVTVLLLFYGLGFWLQVVGFLGGAVLKNLPGNVKDVGSSPGSGLKWQPVPVSLPGKFRKQRSLAGYSPWGCRVRLD